MTKVKAETKNFDQLDGKEAFSLLSEHVNQNFSMKKKPLNDLKIRNQTKKDCYSYQLVYVTMTTRKNWEINFIEGTDSTLESKELIDQNLNYDVKPKQYFKDEVVNLIVPNTGVYFKCEKCNGVGTVARLQQKCSCGNEQDVELNSTNFTCNKCNKSQDTTVQRCTCKNGQVRKILKIQVEFKNKYFSFFYNPCNIPEDYFKNLKGKQIYYEENTKGRVNQLKNFEISDIVEQSSKAINLYENTIAQKQFILSYPVWKCDYTLREENFYLIGNERKVYAPTYPSRTCSIV